jgi:uncharacterized protein YqiB (DUF1249 family)
VWERLLPAAILVDQDVSIPHSQAAAILEVTGRMRQPHQAIVVVAVVAVMLPVWEEPGETVRRVAEARVAEHP